MLLRVSLLSGTQSGGGASSLNLNKMNLAPAGKRADSAQRPSNQRAGSAQRPASKTSANSSKVSSATTKASESAKGK